MDLFVHILSSSVHMYRVIKRIIDFILSLLTIIMLSPLWVFLTLSVALTSRGPVFFTQKRVGRNKTFFNIYKFRTMRIDTPKDIPTHLLKNPAQYITPIGHLLRKTSLDEIPQLINILIGQMSIVGPRPALWNQDDLVAERDKYGANAVTPGLTGWAQINGRDELPIVVKAKLDGEYVKRMNLSFDFKILMLTVKSVLEADGVKEGHNSENSNDR